MKKSKVFAWRLFWTLAIIIAGFLAYVAATILFASSKVITQNESAGAPFLSINNGKVSSSQLKSEGDSRINILLLGRGGVNHPGGNLTDSMELLSIDPQNKTAGIVSIPRDLMVPIPGYSNNKINTAYSLGEQRKKGSGPEMTKQVVSEIFDLPIHYYVDIDFQGFIKIIDSMGGVTVNVEKAFYDPEYPDERMIGYAPFSVKAGVQKMDGKTALKFARSRHGSNGEGSDYARSKRQQQIMKAALDKAKSSDTLLNPKKVLAIINAVGDHFRTDISLKDAEKLLSLAKDMKMDQTQTKILDTSNGGLLKVGDPSLGLGYISIPRLGVNNFTEIQAEIHKFLPDPAITSEGAIIAVDNRSGNTSYGTDIQTLLTDYGYKVLDVRTGTMQAKSGIDDYSMGNKDYALALLAKRFKLTPQKKTKPTGEQADIVIIVGKDYTPKLKITPTPKAKVTNNETPN